jgi:hypothetical protein
MGQGKVGKGFGARGLSTTMSIKVKGRLGFKFMFIQSS